MKYIIYLYLSAPTTATIYYNYIPYTPTNTAIITTTTTSEPV